MKQARGSSLTVSQILCTAGLFTTWVLIASAQPKLVLASKEVDLGTVYNGTIVKANVKITNGGTDSLIIQSIRTSCGCTTVKEPKKALAPGESDDLKVEFNSSGFRGLITKYVHIESNDPSNQYISITFTTTIKEELEPVNHMTLMWLGDATVGKESRSSYILRNIVSNPIAIRKVSKVYPKMTITYDKKTVAPGDSVVVSVLVVPDHVGYFNEEFTLETDSKNQPHVPIRVSYVGVKR